MMLPRNSPHRTESTLAYNNNNNNGSSLFQRKPLAPINSEFKISKPQHIKPNTHSHTFTTPTPKTRNTATTTTTTTTTNNNNRNNHQYRNPNLNTSLVFTPTKNSSSSSSSSHSSSLLSSSPFVEEPENQPESNHTRATSHYRTTSTSQYKSSANKDASHSLIPSSKRKTSTKQTSESTNPKRRTTTTATQNTNNNKILNPSLSSSTIRFSTVSSSTSSSTTTTITSSSSSSSHTSPKPQQQLTLDDFEFGKILGKGKLGRVYCVKHKQLGLIFALKVMSKSEIMNLKLEKSLRREIEIQSNLYHINITRLYSWFHDSINIYLLLEYSIEGELYTHLKKLKRFDNIMASNYIFQITQALIFLHQRGIIHRDLKPENIMVSLDNQLKLSDFGWSVQINQNQNQNQNQNHNQTQTQKTPHQKKQKQKRLTICGTLDYLPPEMIESKSHDFSVDIWALGILCYELLVGKPPFEAINRNITYEKIAKVDIKYPSNLDVDAIDLISKLVVKDPNKRLSLKEVLNHNWIIKNKPKWPKNIYK